MEVKLYTQAYISENVTCNIFDNNEVIKKLSTKYARTGLENSSVIIIPLQDLCKCA